MSMPNIQPSIDLYNQVKGGLIIHGNTLNAWCRDNAVTPANARQCLIGSWDGPKAKALRARLIKASGMVIPSSSESENHSSPTQPATTGAPDFFYWGC